MAEVAKQSREMGKTVSVTEDLTKKKRGLSDVLDSFNEKIGGSSVAKLDALRSRLLAVGGAVVGLGTSLGVAIVKVIQFVKELSALDDRADRAQASLQRLATQVNQEIRSGDSPLLTALGLGDEADAAKKARDSVQAQKDALNEELTRALDEIDAAEFGKGLNPFGLDFAQFSFGGIGEEEAKRRRDRAQKTFDNTFRNLTREQQKIRENERERSEAARARVKDEAEIAALRAEGRETDADIAAESLRRREAKRTLDAVLSRDRELGDFLLQQEARRQAAFDRSIEDRRKAERDEALAKKAALDEEARRRQEVHEKELARIEAVRQKAEDAVEKELRARLEAIRKFGQSQITGVSVGRAGSLAATRRRLVL